MQLKAAKRQQAVWDAAKTIRPGAEITAYYDSTRGNGIMDMTGTVRRVHWTGEELIVEFERPDGQVVYVKDTGGCYSVGSDYPFNGELTQLDVRNPGDFLPTSYWV